MIRCPFCNHNNPPGATRCAECKAELFNPDEAASAPPSGADSNSLDGRVLALLTDGRKIEAIKLYRDVTGAGLKEAKDAVESLERGGSLPKRTAPGTNVDQPQILELLRAGQKIRAIKLYRDQTGSGLADAKNAVEALARAEGLPAGNSGCGSAALSLLAIAVLTAYLVIR